MDYIAVQIYDNTLLQSDFDKIAGKLGDRQNSVYTEMTSHAPRCALAWFHNGSSTGSAYARLSTKDNMAFLRTLDHSSLRGDDLGRAKAAARTTFLQCPNESSDYSMISDVPLLVKLSKTDYSVRDDENGPKKVFPLDYATRLMRPVTVHSYEKWEGIPAIWEPPITILLKPLLARNQRQRSDAGYQSKLQSRAAFNVTVEERKSRRSPDRPTGGDDETLPAGEAQPALEDRPSGKSKGKRASSRGRDRSQERKGKKGGRDRSPSKGRGKGKDKGKDKGKGRRGKSPGPYGKGKGHGSHYGKGKGHW